MSNHEQTSAFPGGNLTLAIQVKTKKNFLERPFRCSPTAFERINRSETLPSPHLILRFLSEFSLQPDALVIDFYVQSGMASCKNR